MDGPLSPEAQLAAVGAVEISAARAADPPPPPPPVEPEPDALPEGSELVTEDVAALRFAHEHKDALRYDHDAGAWYQWCGSHWQRDRTRMAYTWARRVARQLGEESGSFKAQLSAGRAAFAGGVERLAQADPCFAVTAARWDADPWLLGTPGGVVDLRTGILRPAEPRNYVTRVTAVAPAETAHCPAWRDFLAQACGGDLDLAQYLARWFGYCLTGSTREHALLFVYGPGGNGKGVLLNTVAGILGTLGTVAAMETFTASHGDRHPTDLAMLAGARLVLTTETEEGRAWAEARIKALTGGDPIAARFMRRDFFTFTPAFKLTVSGNHKPVLRNIDDAARRRFNVVPFLHRPERPDPELPERLRREWPGILRWMLDGCLAWQRDGLAPPPVVRDATAEYFAEMDVFGAWAAERCVFAPDLCVRPSELLTDFNAWAKANGEKEATRHRLKAWLKQQPGLGTKAVNGTRYVSGLGLNPPPQRRASDD